MTQKILVIAPHADDEILGVGGTIAHHIKEGNEVACLICTSAYFPEWSKTFIKNRDKEIEAAHKILKIHHTIKLDLPTVKLDQVSQVELNKKIFDVVLQIDPHIMYIPYAYDLNLDHRLIYYSCLVATRPAGRNLRKLLSYETLSVTEWGLRPFIPNYYISLTEEEINLKIEAMKCYSSELKVMPHPRSIEGITTLAQRRGMEIFNMFAEAFQVIRIIR